MLSGKACGTPLYLHDLELMRVDMYDRMSKLVKQVMREAANDVSVTGVRPRFDLYLTHAQQTLVSGNI